MRNLTPINLLRDEIKESGTMSNQDGGMKAVTLGVLMNRQTFGTLVLTISYSVVLCLYYCPSLNHKNKTR